MTLSTSLSTADDTLSKKVGLRYFRGIKRVVDRDLRNVVFYFCCPSSRGSTTKSPRQRDSLFEVKHEDPVLRTFILFTQTAHAVLKYGDANLFRKAGLSEIKFIVLQLLAANGGTAEPSQLAAWTLRERHDITTLVKRMQRDGLVKAERNQRDRRFVNIMLTDKGKKLLDRTTPAARDTVNQTMSSISEQDALLLEKLLRVLRQNALSGLENLSKSSRHQSA